jgi:di/tricarboxylate transporter
MVRARGLAALVFLFAVIAYLVPHPAGVTPQLLRMGELLNATGTTQVFAESVGTFFVGIPWLVVLLVGIGVPPRLAVFSLLCLANLAAGLTHYGTTTAPILFSLGYVSLRDWWRVGFLVSLVNLAIWLTVGFAWWKLLGFY